MDNVGNELEERTKDWLVKTGFPLEMRVANAFLQAEQEAWQSAFYRDHETGKAREIDVVARDMAYYEPYKDNNSIAELLIYTVIECKGDNRHPWVIFKGLRNRTNFLLDVTLCTPKARALLRYADSDLTPSILRKNAIRSGTGATRAMIGKNNNDAKEKGLDNVYEALFQSFKASEARIVELAEDDRTNYAHNGNPHFQPALVLPVVITTAPLFECGLSGDNDLQLKEVDYSAVMFRYPRNLDTRFYYPDYAGVVIHIFRESALSTLIEGVGELTRGLQKYLPRLFKTQQR